MPSSHAPRLAFALLLPYALALSCAQPASAAPRIILDYRKEAPSRPPVVSAQIRAVLASALGKPLATDRTAILGHARGAFSKAGAAEDVYLVGDEAPIAAQAFPQGPAQRLVLVSGGRGSVYTLPAELRYQRIAGVVPAGKEGGADLLLEAAAYNMGQAVISVDRVALVADGTAGVTQSLKEVVSDSCDNRRGTRERRVSTIAMSADGTLVATAHVQRCGKPADGGR